MAMADRQNKYIALEKYNASISKNYKDMMSNIESKSPEDNIKLL
jgi:hypothetical protein